MESIGAFASAKPENVIISTGSGEILTAAVMEYCPPARAVRRALGLGSINELQWWPELPP